MLQQDLEIRPSVSEAVRNEPLLRPVMPELDSIRGLAIFMVLIYHAFYWHGGFTGLSRIEHLFVYATWIGRLGVNLFFVLSGFLITGLLLQSVDRPDYYKRFYLRRALRILPAYYAILLALLIFHESSWQFLGLSSIYLSNLTPLFGVAMSYPVLWSLAVEEHFYLVWPMVVRQITARSLIRLSIGIILITPIFRWISLIIEMRHGPVSFTFNNYTWNSTDALACGALLVLALREFRWSRKTLLTVSVSAILGAAAIFLVCIPFGILHRQDTPIGAALQITPWNIGFTGFLGLFLLIGTSGWKSLVLLPPLRYLGRISYGLYLVHLLIFDAYDSVVPQFLPKAEMAFSTFSLAWIRFLCAGFVAVGIAHLSREYFESIFLNLKDRLETGSAGRNPVRLCAAQPEMPVKQQ